MTRESTQDKAKRLKKLKTELVTGLEASRIKGVSPKAVYEAIESGRLASVMVGRTHLINRKDLENWKIVGHRTPKPTRHHPYHDEPVEAE